MSAVHSLQKPEPIEVNFGNIPPSLYDYPHWVVWRLTSKSGKWTKPPFQANGEYAKSNDDTTHTSFDQVSRAYKTGDFDGIGIVFRDGICGIDLDHVLSPDGSIQPWAEEITDRFAGTYIEMSPSSDGIHILAKGVLPRSGKAGPENRLEFYDQSSPRYFTVTGQVISDVTEITDQQDAIDWLFDLYAKNKTKTTADKKAVPLSPNRAQEFTDEEIVTKAKRAGNREKFTKLFGGDFNGYSSQSEADQALCNQLSYWTQDASQIDRIFRASGLYRAKWDESRASDGTTYGEKTIGNALKSDSAKIRAEAAARSTERSEEAPETRSSGFEFVCANDLLSNPKPIPWLIKGILEQETLGLLFGASGSGKSFLAIDWACCVVTGNNWHGHEVEQGTVFYIAGEGHAGLRRRLKAWELTNNALPGNSLFISKTPALLMDEENAENIALAVVQMTKQHGLPRLIIVDTLARNMGSGDENSNTDMNKFVNNLDQYLRTRFKASVLIVHHTGHGDKERARGASSLRAAMDHEYRLDEKDGYRTLVCTKAKESDAPEPMTFRLEQVVLEGWPSDDQQSMVSATLVHIEATPDNKKVQSLTKGGRIAFQSLKDAIDRHGVEISVNEQASTCETKLGVTSNQWKECAFDAGISTGSADAKRKAFERALKNLKEQKIVSGSDDYYWIS